MIGPSAPPIGELHDVPLPSQDGTPDCSAGVTLQLMPGFRFTALHVTVGLPPLTTRLTEIDMSDEEDGNCVAAVTAITLFALSPARSMHASVYVTVSPSASTGLEYPVGLLSAAQLDASAVLVTLQEFCCTLFVDHCISADVFGVMYTVGVELPLALNISSVCVVTLTLVDEAVVPSSHLQPRV